MDCNLSSPLARDNKTKTQFLLPLRLSAVEVFANEQTLVVSASA